MHLNQIVADTRKRNLSLMLELYSTRPTSLEATDFRFFGAVNTITEVIQGMADQLVAR